MPFAGDFLHNFQKYFFLYTENMFTPKYYYTPLRLGNQIDFEPVIPGELAQYFDVAERVTRYNFTENQVNFVFQDNVAVHTKRLVNYLRNIDLPDFFEKDTIERMLWLHDLPEAVVNEERGSDYVTHEKNADAALEKFQDSREENVAKDMLSPEDFRLFQETEQSKGMIKSADWSKIPDYRDGILAKMIDWIDGRNNFTHVITEWIGHDDFLTNPVLPPLAVFHLCMLQSYQVWIESFSRIDDAVFRDFMVGFIHDEIYDYHRLRWDPVIERVTPEIQSLYADFVRFGEKQKR